MHFHGITSGQDRFGFNHLALHEAPRPKRETCSRADFQAGVWILFKNYIVMVSIAGMHFHLLVCQLSVKLNGKHAMA
jgi:hypothetical protein